MQCPIFAEHMPHKLPKSTSDDSHLAGDSKQSENKDFAGIAAEMTEGTSDDTHLAADSERQENAAGTSGYAPPVQEERRVAGDGNSYTFQQFLDYYGEECGTSLWNAAQDTRHIAANLPKSISDNPHLAGDKQAKPHWEGGSPRQDITNYVLSQPWCEKRSMKHKNGWVEYWYHCTVCNRGITDAHLNSSRHQDKVNKRREARIVAKPPLHPPPPPPPPPPSPPPPALQEEKKEEEEKNEEEEVAPAAEAEGAAEEENEEEEAAPAAEAEGAAGPRPPPRQVRFAEEAIELFFCPDTRRWYHYKDEDSWCWADAFIEVYTDPCSKQDYYFDFKTGNWCWAYHVPSEFEGMYFDC